MTATVERVMIGMGFPETENGPFVSALREKIKRDIADGLISRSAGTWAKNNISHEDRARHLLAWDWAIERGHSYVTKTMDPIYGWSTDVRTMKRSFYVRWHRILPWIGDRCREIAMKARVFRDKYVLKLQNPYI